MSNTVTLIPKKPVRHTLLTDTDYVVYMPIASKNSHGIAKIGDGLNITTDGLLSVNFEADWFKNLEETIREIELDITNLEEEVNLLELDVDNLRRSIDGVILDFEDINVRLSNVESGKKVITIYQLKQDNSLKTYNKTVVGGINELNESVTTHTNEIMKNLRLISDTRRDYATKTFVEDLCAKIELGLTKPVVFDTFTNFISWLSGNYNRADGFKPEQLKIGDLVLIEAKEVPDYWVRSKSTPMTIDNFAPYEAKVEIPAVKCDNVSITKNELDEIQAIGLKNGHTKIDEDGVTTTDFAGYIELSEEDYGKLRKNGSVSIGNETIYYDPRVQYVTPDTSYSMLVGDVEPDENTEGAVGQFYLYKKPNPVNELDANANHLLYVCTHKKLQANGSFYHVWKLLSVDEALEVFATLQNAIKDMSNPNMVINGDFRVNQRNKSIYSNSTYYTADGWQLGKNNDGSFDVSTKTLSTGKSGTYAILTQYVNVDIVALKGRQLTLSADIKGDGVNTVYLQFGFFTGSNFTQIAVNIIRNAPATMNRYVITGTIPDNVTSVNSLAVRPYINAGSCVIDNIKLELGTVATPYNQRPYSEELAICQMPSISGNQNLSTTYSNENILINGDFRVNQRMFASTTDVGFTVDRWQNIRENTLVTLNNDGTITLSSTPTQSTNTLLTQKLEEKDYENLLGGAITVSAMVSLDEGQTYNVYSITAVLPQTLPTTAINNEIYFTDDTGVRHGSVRQYWTGAQFEVDVFGYYGYNVRVKWVKLEKGEVATPYNPRPYAEELVMCQRYYQELKINNAGYSHFDTTSVTVNGSTFDTYGVSVSVPLITSMRTANTIEYTTMPYIRNYDGINKKALGTIADYSFTRNQLLVTYHGDSTIKSGVIYYVYNGTITIDGEIH